MRTLRTVRAEIGLRRVHRDLRVDRIELDQQLPAPHALRVVGMQRESPCPFSRLVMATTSPPT